MKCVLCFVARASRRAASTVVSTFCTAPTPTHFEPKGQRSIQEISPIAVAIVISSPFAETHVMKRTLAQFTVGAVTVAVTYLMAARPAKRTPAHITRPAVAFDMSPPLGSMEQFIPDKSVVIHPAVQSQPERQGATEGPGMGLGETAPTPPRSGATAPRAGSRTARAAEVPLTPPVAPQINAAGAAVEQ